jgi:hypothetical protein
VRESQAAALANVFIEVGAIHSVHVVRVQACTALEHGRLILLDTKNSIIFLAKEKAERTSRLAFTEVNGLRPNLYEIS